MDNWDEVRTAYQVARMGTVSGAADVLGVHHATVIRHIDALEIRLGAKLFQRHARGYTATEAGTDLLRVAQITDDQFSQLMGRIKGQGQGVSGDLVVTSINALSPLLTPVLTEFQEEHPEVCVRFLTGDRVLRLEYGEAHVAIRAGTAPDQPDNVVQPFIKLGMRLVASKGYIEKYGKPDEPEQLKDHKIIGHNDDNSRAPFRKWMRATVPESAIVYRVTDNRAMIDAVVNGAGIGFVSDWVYRNDDTLVEILPSQDDWGAPVWLVTHVDLHRTAKVQAFLTHLKARAKEWGL